MKTYRIGVISDTRVADLSPALPPPLWDALRDIDLLFHLGNVTDESTLSALGRLAPVIAVGAEHDRVRLPRSLTIPVCGHSIALVHGRQEATPPRAGQEMQSFLAGLMSAFGGANAVLFGQLRRPYMAWHDGVLLFCPGAVFHRTIENARAELASRPPARRRSELLKWLAVAEEDPAWAAPPPTVGLLTVSQATVEAEIIALQSSPAVAPSPAVPTES